MFQHFRNIETAFRHVRLFSFVLIGACMAICCFTIYESYRMVSAANDRIYLLANGKALEAFSAERKANLPVEAVTTSAHSTSSFLHWTPMTR